MKKKSETKKATEAFAEEQKPEAEKAKNETSMNDEEFDRYIDGIMVKKKEEPEEEKKIASDDIQSLRDDVNRIIRNLTALTNYIHANISKNEQNETAAQEQPVQTKAEMGYKMPGQKMQDSFAEEKMRTEMIKKRMLQQEEEIKKSFPDFDFRALYTQNSEFKAEFDKTGSMYGAYLKLLAGKFASGTQAKNRNFIENGAMPAMESGSVSTSAAGLPDKEFDEYIKNIIGG